ncbi:unnamed protein product [Commensalibacter communis]|uniref:DUF4145 domain-containing protein n=1 Tax=Commensalibacter communis TaxID=2972786 RepID=UPI0022FF50C3|nr:DUF4145 domain-containing protein [Commensalibacter communis]CAI3924160.1 unnamed protein product [Commensalibacter communis]
MELLIAREILLNEYFLEEALSRFICPTCKQSLLQIMKDYFKYRLNKYGLLSCEYSDVYDADKPIGIFSCLLICSDLQCQETVSCCGNFIYQQLEYTRGNVNDITEFSPKYFYPHLRLFKIPELCPTNVKQAIEESFATFFSSITATTNSIRISIEALLREHAIFSKDENGKFVPLHRRIESIPETSELYLFKEQLLTLKYMGNDGSHSESTVEKEDIVDAYEVLSDVLDKLYLEKKDVSITIKKLNDEFSKK